MRAFFALLAVAAAIVAVPAATGTTPPPATALAVVGSFSNVSGGAAAISFCGQISSPACPPGSGAATQVRFGTPASAGQQSGLGFTPTSVTSVPLSTNFVVGTLKHFNFPIYNGASSVRLTVTLNADTADGHIAFNLPFTIGIDETENIPPCTYSPVVVDCPDALHLPPGGVSASQAVGSLHTYTLTVLGFTANAADTTPQSQLVTQEQSENTGYLVASLSRNNTAPTAGDDSAAAVSGGSTTVPVLANDADADSDPLTPVVDTPPAHGTATVNTDGTVTYTANLGFAGTDTFTYRASDGFTSSAPATVTIHVADTTGPTLSLPADITKEATSAAGANVTYDATASDNVDGSLPPACTPPSGSTFPIGTTQVDCSATDAAGNTTTGSFHVTVSDTTAPTLSAVPSSITTEASGPGGSIVTYTPPTASDAVDASPTVTCVPPSGSTFALGTQTVSCTAKDATGNESAPQTFTVTVSDTTAPTLTVPASFEIFSPDPAGMAVTFTATATDAVDPNPTVTCTPPSGSSFAPGATTVSCTAADASGNTSTAKTFTVTVVTNHAPACANVRATAPTLWPPNHQFERIGFAGATDPDGDSLTYAVTGVRQDEALLGEGSGNFAPDARRTGGALELRSERAGQGDGRVYTVSLSVSDGRGGSCTATAAVTVRHDQAHAAVKSAPSYDSFG